MIKENADRLRLELISVCRELHRRGLIAATDGNVSCRSNERSMLITPSGKPKGELGPEDLLEVDLEGQILEGNGKPSNEILMHLLVYTRRSDVSAVVHAHPPMLTAFTLAGIPFAADCLPEVWLAIGPVPTAAYATPSTEEVPRSIEPLLEGHEAILLERHGSLTFGRNLKQAYMRLEKLEHAAHTLYYAHVLRKAMPPPLPEDAMRRLKQLGEPEV